MKYKNIIRKSRIINGIEFTKLKIFLQNFPYPKIKILHLTDFHFRKNNKTAEKIYSIIKHRTYDFVFYTGDYANEEAGVNIFLTLARKMNARYGQYAVLGNHDYRIDLVKFKEALDKNKIILLINEHKLIKSEADNTLDNKLNNNKLNKHKSMLFVKNNKNNQNNYSMKNFNIIGVDVNVHDDVNPKVVHRDNLEKAMKNTGLNSFKILLAHSPDIIKKASANGIDFVLCGHTHGGQIRVPFIGPVYASSIYGTKYASGIFKEKNTLMYVSRGIGCVPVNIGMSRLKVPFTERRAFCRPEITEIILCNELLCNEFTNAEKTEESVKKRC